MLLFIIAKTLLEIQILALCRDRVKMSRAEVRRIPPEHVVKLLGAFSENNSSFRPLRFNRVTSNKI